MVSDANRSTANTTLTAPNGKFTAGDVGKSVTGGPYKSLARITAYSTATTVTVDADGTAAGVSAPVANCTDADGTAAA